MSKTKPAARRQQAEGSNTDPSPMDHEVIRVPSRIQERQRVANQGETMTMAELQQSAAALGVDTSGIRVKRDVQEAILAAGSAGGADANTSPET